jgi:hypothetical protein
MPLTQTSADTDVNVDTDVVMKENAAAAALVGVAASLASSSASAKRKAADSPIASAILPLPTNSTSRRQWDQEQAGAVTAATNTTVTAAGCSIQEMFPPPLATTMAGISAAAKAATGSTLATVAEATKTHGFFTKPTITTTAAAAADTTTTQQQQNSQSSVVEAARTGEGQWGAPPAYVAPATAADTDTDTTARRPSQAPAALQVAASSSDFFCRCPALTLESTLPVRHAPPMATMVGMPLSLPNVPSETPWSEVLSVRLPTAAHLRQSISVHLKIGVPARQSTTSSCSGVELLQPMYVDTMQLLSLLPQSVHVHPIEVVIGGLLVDQQQQQGFAAAPAATADPPPTICTAVASVTLQ